MRDTAALVRARLALRSAERLTRVAFSFPTPFARPPQKNKKEAVTHGVDKIIRFFIAHTIIKKKTGSLNRAKVLEKKQLYYKITTSERDDEYPDSQRYCTCANCSTVP